jgi:hypothetical protein
VRINAVGLNRSCRFDFAADRECTPDRLIMQRQSGFGNDSVWAGISDLKINIARNHMPAALSRQAGITVPQLRKSSRHPWGGKSEDLVVSWLTGRCRHRPQVASLKNLRVCNSLVGLYSADSKLAGAHADSSRQTSRAL